mmetsp:Transcript_6234/g.16936  ORF Transcript_6234/g.16936 Transcript_6234/m.16936 type:complete len:136 (-) Transcript_6234:61-468(-)
MAHTFDLAAIIHELRSMRVTLELRSDALVVGVIEEADEEMNTTMTNVTVSDPQGIGLRTFERLFIRGKQIRQVQIPDDVDVVRTLQQRKERAERQRRRFRVHKRNDKAREQRASAAQAHGHRSVPARGTSGHAQA